MTEERRVFLAPFDNPLAGRWVDACEATEELERLREKWGDVDFGAMDSEGFGGAVNEYTPVDEIVRLDELIEDHGEAFVAFLKVEGAEHATVDRFEDAYSGQYDSHRAFAEEIVEQCGYLDEMPEQLLGYFDYDAFARDLMFEHYEQDGHYFRSC